MSPRVPNDPKRIVTDGYHAVASRYLDWSESIDAPIHRFRSLVVDAVAAGSWGLDLGCGSGLRTARALSERFRVVGVDFSAEQLEMARELAPDAALIRADMTELHFQSGSFDAVVALYAIIHVPREAHGELLGRIARSGSARAGSSSPR